MTTHYLIRKLNRVQSERSCLGSGGTIWGMGWKQKHAGEPHPGGFHSKMCACANSLQHVQLFATPWTAACQASLSMGFSRREYWSGLPFPPPGDLPDPGIKLRSLTFPALAGGFSTTSTTWEALKMSPFLFLQRSPALPSQAGSRISSTDSVLH